MRYRSMAGNTFVVSKEVKSYFSNVTAYCEGCDIVFRDWHSAVRFSEFVSDLNSISFLCGPTTLTESKKRRVRIGIFGGLGLLFGSDFGLILVLRKLTI